MNYEKSAKIVKHLIDDCNRTERQEIMAAILQYHAETDVRTDEKRQRILHDEANR